MNKNLAKQIAATITSDELKQMFITAKKKTEDWTKVSSLNKGMTKGVAFNIFTASDITDKTHSMVKVNMIREFGEFLPNQEKYKKDKKKIFKELIHQDPNTLDEEWFKI